MRRRYTASTSKWCVVAVPLCSQPPSRSFKDEKSLLKSFSNLLRSSPHHYHATTRNSSTKAQCQQTRKIRWKFIWIKISFRNPAAGGWGERRLWEYLLYDFVDLIQSMNLPLRKETTNMWLANWKSKEQKSFIVIEFLLFEWITYLSSDAMLMSRIGCICYICSIEKICKNSIFLCSWHNFHFLPSANYLCFEHDSNGSSSGGAIFGFTI